MRFLSLPVVLLALSVAASASPKEIEWQNLQQLQPGDRIEVILKSKAKHAGTFVMLADDAITLRTTRGEKGFPRNDVARVSRVGSARRGRAALIGLAAGAAAGAAFGAAISGRDCDRTQPGAIAPCIEPTRAQGAAAGGILFGAIGSGVAAIAARRDKTEIFRAAVTPARTEIRAANSEATAPPAASPATKGSN